MKNIEVPKPMASRPMTSNKVDKKSVKEMESMTSRPMTEMQNEPAREPPNTPKIMLRTTKPTPVIEESKVAPKVKDNRA